MKDLLNHFDILDIKIGPELGQGQNGKVYSLIDTSKVIKFGVSYYIEDIIDNYKAINYIKENNLPAYCKVIDYIPFSLITNNSFYLYIMIMEKLNKISIDEEKVFHTILSHEDRNIIKNYSTTKIKKILGGMARGLDFDAEKIILFCDNLKDLPIQHLDIHPRNILKDDNGHFKLIDLDRCKLEIKR